MALEDLCRTKMNQHTLRKYHNKYIYLYGFLPPCLPQRAEKADTRVEQEEKASTSNSVKTLPISLQEELSPQLSLPRFDIYGAAC